MLDSISYGRLVNVHPALRRKVLDMSADLETQGIVIRVVQAMRTVEEQDALYCQGRTAPGKIVTNCPGGLSYHNFGLAVDCVPSLNGLDASYYPDWNEKHPAWQAMITAAVKQGLHAGALWRTFHDWPHFQLTGRFPEGAPNGELHALFAAGGLPAVWEAVSPT